VLFIVTLADPDPVALRFTVALHFERPLTKKGHKSRLLGRLVPRTATVKPSPAQHRSCRHFADPHEPTLGARPSRRQTNAHLFRTGKAGLNLNLADASLGDLGA